MVDTLVLDMQDFEVERYPNLELQQARINLLTGEALGSEANLFHNFIGTKAIGNTDKTHVDIFAGRDGKVHAVTHFSVPKQVADTNYNELNYSGFLKAMDNAQQDIAKLGVKANLDSAVITRLDIFKNVEPAEPIACYAKIFELLNANYAKDKRTYGVGGWLLGNTQQQYCIYNKVEELKHNNKSGNFDSLPDTLRFEHRSLNSNKVKNLYGFTTVSELKAGWNSLYNKRRDIWRDNFFRYEVEDIKTLAVSGLVKCFQFYQAKDNRKWFDNFLRSYGAVCLCEVAGIEAVKKALEDMGCSRMKAYRLERTVKQKVFELKALEAEQQTSISLGALYSELKSKVLA